MPPLSDKTTPRNSTRALAAHLSDFASRAGHDLCGPLNQANSLASLFVKRYRGNLDADADVMLDHLAGSAHRMEELIAGLRTYLEAAAPLPRLEVTDLNQVLIQALASLRGPIERTCAVITSGQLPEIITSPARLQTLLEVLIANSIRFVKPGIAPLISIHSSALAEGWRFSVCDEGIGIEPGERENVFLPFRRLQGRTWPGPGLGLSTAQLIVESFGGEIHIEEGASGGICVVFTISRAQP
jgi:light-regulated signal transduction histidine kinase (bacteriophytochrome)